ATDVWRLHGLLRDANGTQVEAALDVGSVSSGARTTPIVEVELEHKSGPVQGLFDLATAWVAQHGLWLSTITKAHRGQRLLMEAAADGDTARAVSAGRALLLDGTDGASLLRALLQSTLDQVLANASEVADGVVAAPVIHQLRVGLRRLRTVVRELAALSPMLNAELDAPLSVVFGRLGQQRDLQALGPAVQPLLQAAGAPLSALPATPAADPVAAVRETAFQTALIALLALAHAGDERFARLSHKETLRHVAGRLDKLHRGLAGESKHFEALPIARQHRARKRLKRLRYLAELTAALWPRKAAAQQYLKRLRAAQDALGTHNDVAVAAEAFRVAASRQPEAWFAAGYLQAHLAVTARGAGRALIKVADGKRFWT
ncbi:MAG TPA: CHAD domain-containing protein, partial [Rubrivivax sp.]|nr:CHAD domain-containing protein [Rubrivivax sp.]